MLFVIIENPIIDEQPLTILAYRMLNYSDDILLFRIFHWKSFRRSEGKTIVIQFSGANFTFFLTKK